MRVSRSAPQCNETSASLPRWGATRRLAVGIDARVEPGHAGPGEAALTSQSRAWLLVGLVITLVHAPLLTKPFVDSDEAVYASIAALSSEVGHLYGDGGVDNKFPGIFWIYAAV